jgi:paraquat-inducible protein B
MPDTSNTNPVVPESKVVSKKRTKFSFIWLIPLFAAAVGAWIAVNTIRNEGPTITIIFKSAEGLEANKTKILYNGVEVGEINHIRLSEDYQTVIATAKMSPKTEEFLLKDTQFWVVRPQISGATVSGLSTLISGAYIGMEIGRAKEAARKYTALDDAPLEIGGVTGRFYTLKTPQLGSLSKGTPLFFRRLQAGEVESYALDKSGKFLNVVVFVKSPYDQFVRPGTRFWHASGIDLSLSASGLKVQTESMLSILIGGIAFETPAEEQQASPAAANTTFDLFNNRAEAFRPPAFNPHEYKLIFKESLRGLEVGAPVTLNGITIGEVTKIHALYDPQQSEFVAPVTIEVDPERYGVDFVADPTATGMDAETAHQKTIDTFVARGLRAQLKTGSLITGSRYVAMEFFPDAQPVTLDWSQKPLQFPTQPGNLESIESGVAQFVQKLNKVPLEQIGNDLSKTIVGVQTTLTNTDRLLTDANKMFRPGSEFDAQINQTLQQFGGAAQALRVLADYLERHPESLIHGKPGEAK